MNECKIQNFCHSEFSDHKIIGQGGFAVVYSTIFRGKKYALKSLNNNIVLDTKAFKQIKNEIKSLYNENINHPNIIKLHGFSRDPSTDNFMLVLQYANCGNLQEHLRRMQKENIYKISWAELIKIAKEITSGLEHLHTNGIIHRDLHSKNILMDNGKVLITDFGLSKRWDDNTASESSNNAVGVMAYVEPQCFIQNGRNFKRNEKSDIYSLGVLFWELTSGIPPFKNYHFAFQIQAIFRNEREKVISGTPSEYANLYKKCWSSDPDQRPVLNEILIELESLSNLSIKFMINYIEVDAQYLSKDLGFSNDTNTSLKPNSIEDPKERIDAITDSDIHSSSRENRNRQKDSQSNIDQIVDEFVSKIDLTLLCMIDNSYMPVYVKGSRRTNPVNKFFQFKSVVAKYAKKHKVLGYNDRIILSKAQSKLWTMLSEEQKKVFKKLYEKALKFHNDESVLDTKFMNASQLKLKWKKIKKEISLKKPNQKMLVTNTVNVPSSPCAVISDFDFNFQDTQLLINTSAPCAYTSRQASPNFFHLFTSPTFTGLYNEEVQTQIPFLSEDTTFLSEDATFFNSCTCTSEDTITIWPFSPYFNDSSSLPFYTPENIIGEPSPISPNSKWPISSKENEDKLVLMDMPESKVQDVLNQQPKTNNS